MITEDCVKNTFYQLQNFSGKRGVNWSQLGPRNSLNYEKLDLHIIDLLTPGLSISIYNSKHALNIHAQQSWMTGYRQHDDNTML